MSKNTYEYTFTTDDGEDYTVNLKVVSFTSTKGSFSLQAPDPDDYYGSSEIEWECAEDLSEISKEQIDSMEEWLFNEHSEYLQDLSYYD